MAVNGLEHSLAKALEGRCLSIQRIEEGFPLWPGHRPAQDHIFRLIPSSAENQEPLLFLSYRRHEKSVECTVQPHHFQHYMGSWLLIAWCELREGWRKLYLCRMDAVRILDTTFVPSPRQEWGHHVEGAFGIYQGKKTCEVRLLFSPFMSRYIEEQQEQLYAIQAGCCIFFYLCYYVDYGHYMCTSFKMFLVSFFCCSKNA